jgi:FlaA1/EpsC-like NDP-sugar epimerase
MILNLKDNLLQLNRLNKKIIMVLVDAALTVLILLSSFSIRLGYLYWPDEGLIWFIFGAPIILIPIFISFRLYRSVIRYIGFKVLLSIVQAVSLYALVWGLLGYMTSIDGIPRSVIIINWMLTIIVMGGSRFLARWIFSDSKSLSKIIKKNVIIYGAGPSGRELSQSLQLSKEYKHVAYIDETAGQYGAYINNVPVFPFANIDSIVKNQNVSQVLLVEPSISRKKRYEIINKLSFLPVQVRSLPSISELAKGSVKIDDLLEIDISELLGRKISLPNESLLKTNIANKVVLITGAGGSIGSELCRQVVLLKPKKLIIFDISESSLYQIEQELKRMEFNSLNIVPVLGSIGDQLRVEGILKEFRVNTIYHAAAYKHVPLVEFNQSEGVMNNSIGTLILAQASIKANVEIFVLVSTDKAVRPTNIMGASKRVAELILQAFSNQSSNTCFTMVRFGNVINSSGSVIPLFRKQIKEGGPLTVTDRAVVRYFMTIPEAVELTIQAGAMGKGGDVFVLDMGKPISIYELALKMIELSGLQVIDENNPDGDIEIIYTGLRPGEKLYEELLVGDNVSKTDNKMIMRANEEMIEWDILQPLLFKLRDVSLINDSRKVRKLLKEIIPEFNPNSKSPN